ncbi:uncharacterized protein LOC107873417 isoform X1 [Capsicum annuum]|uniref:uncharacterized protein LOC107873417 isoform X1 n=1 Tax=Capsicum annuum TaxID=4072 RepID=UPI001FB05C37|nr:uncharacterized protein LOC107873417 isoform X1 [Capsicum annuum]
MVSRDMDTKVTSRRRSLLKPELSTRKVDSRETRKNSLSGEGKRSNNSETNSIRKVKKCVKLNVNGEDENVVKRKHKERKTLDQRENRKKSESFSRNKVEYKKNLGEERLLKKKKKRGIRLDPHDTSNKRLDDGLTSKEAEPAMRTPFDGTTTTTTNPVYSHLVGSGGVRYNNKEKQEDSAKEKTVEMSKNAQFRAICPSPSVLSFVEDNLLGRRRDIQIKRAGYNIELSAPLDNIPFSTNSERDRIEEPVFRNKLEFFAAAKVSSSFPPVDLPEIAFAGRSNVGKSSLLNALTRQWGVVRTSDKPGLTQTINFFKLGPKMCMVDLPGYGFAYAKEEVKEAWEELVKDYVSTRLGLKRVCLLIDTKWGMKQRDHELIDLMERAQTKYQIILTKTDTVFPIDVARRAMQIEESLKSNKSVVQPVVMVSSKSGAGIRSLRTVLAKIARFVKP